MLKALSTLVACAALTGCLDARKSYDDYAKRIVDGNTSMPDRPAFTTIPDVSGHFLFGAHIKGIPDTAIIQLLVDYTMVANDDGTAKLTYAASALMLPDRTVSAGPPVAPQFMSTDMHVSLDGTYTAPLTGTLPGDANPVIPGDNVVVAGVLHGEIHSTDLVCGTLTGTAGPLALDGSTFGSIRIAPGTIGSALPDPIFKCPDPTGDAGVR